MFQCYIKIIVVCKNCDTS